MTPKYQRIILCALALLGPGKAGAQTLTADLSSHIIGITTGFVGANLVLFGSTDRPGDIVVLVRGPATDMVVRRKQKILGVWLNGRNIVFHDTPSYYAVAATKGLSDIAGPDILARHNIGLDNIKLRPATPLPQTQLPDFRGALIASQEKNDLFRSDVARVSFLGEHLFRTDMEFPANVPTGNYSVEIFLFSGGELIGAQTTPLIVSRIGFSNGVFVVAHRHAALYGAGALLFAVAAGWAASVVFRRV